MRQKLLSVLAGGLALACAACVGQSSAGMVDRAFILYDTDKNGIITKDEFCSHWVDKQRADSAWKTVVPTGTDALSRSQAANVPMDVWSDLETQAEP